MQNVSIVIPTWNEEKNVQPLVERINHTLSNKYINYELIFIDDYSSDLTRENIRNLSNSYPITLYMKNGKKGKAQSLLEGFSYAKFDIIAMIDADLQYPPESLIPMIAQIESGYDIVVAERKATSIGLFRRFISNAFHLIFTQLLHGIHVDSQSGLKVFKKTILRHIIFDNPSPWAFDMEFLVKAKQLGYKIGGIDIFFDKRHSGHSKISIVNASYQIGLSAIKLKIAGLRWKKPDVSDFTKIYPNKKAFSPDAFELTIQYPSLRTRIQRDSYKIRREREFGENAQGENDKHDISKGFYFKGTKYTQYSSLSKTETAIFRLVKKQIISLTILAFFLTASFMANWHLTIVILIAFLMGIYFIDLLFNLFLITRSFSRSQDIRISTKDIQIADNFEWPEYTIFCPLYKEWQVVPQFIRAMTDMDYPIDKLQIMLLLEENDTQTIEKIKNFSLPPNFEIQVVPQGLPKTKPKALNYGLQYARGEFCVIYDAEDVPEPLQLKKTVLAFRKVDPRVVCVQAKLNFYNPSQNLLTRLFTLEYSLWFDLVLTGLQSINATIPLGGTSNHFKTVNIRTLQGWDAFNVTEDCDLGVRLVKKGFKTAIIDSITLEEANSELTNWFTQRSRWIKGYIQTYLVHMRNLDSFEHKLTSTHFVTFQIVVGGKILSMFINPIMWIITVCYFMFRSHIGLFIESFFPGPILYMGVFSLVFGNFLYFYYYMMGCAKREQYELIKYAFFIPFYWLCMSMAAWIAVYEILYKPFYWSKTVHGLHLKKQRRRISRRAENNSFNSAIAI